MDTRTIRLDEVHAAANLIRRDPVLVDAIDASLNKALADVGADLTADERRFVLHELAFPTASRIWPPVPGDPEGDIIPGYAEEF